MRKERKEKISRAERNELQIDQTRSRVDNKTEIEDEAKRERKRNEALPKDGGIYQISRAEW
jgi:hypothetical protein